MSLAAVFFFSAVFSFMGSAPPGVLNMYAFQLGLQKKKTAAVRFALAVGISEFIFAWIALRCAHWIVSVPAVARYFHYMTAAVLTIMGIAMLAAASRPQTKERKSGFRKGLLLSLLNPMVVPFWIGISAYMQLRGWLRAEEFIDVFVFALGASLGVTALQLTYIFLSAKMGTERWREKIKYIPGALLLCLAAYSCFKLF